MASLTDEERREIEGIAARYPKRHTACIDAMLVAQRSRGWLDDALLRELGELLGMTVDELDSVATFYSRLFRKPVGRHVISVCDSVSCFVMGGEKLLAYLERKLGIRAGSTTADGMFTLIPTVCLGHCEQAPAMLVDREIHGNLTEERIDRILEAAARSPAAPLGDARSEPRRRPATGGGTEPEAGK